MLILYIDIGLLFVSLCLFLVCPPLLCSAGPLRVFFLFEQQSLFLITKQRDKLATFLSVTVGDSYTADLQVACFVLSVCACVCACVCTGPCESHHIPVPMAILTLPHPTKFISYRQEHIHTHTLFFFNVTVELIKHNVPG